MTQYQLFPSSSSVQTLIVESVPQPLITGVVWPTSPKTQGAPCLTKMDFQNTGGDGSIFGRILDDIGAVLVTFTFSVIAGETGFVNLSFNMPGNDVTIFAQIGYAGVVLDARGPHFIEVLITIATSLTLALNPNPARPLEDVIWSGRLTRADAQSPGSQSIRLIDDMSGTLMGTVTTDAEGNYSGIFTAPEGDGSYPYVAEFQGAALGNLILAPSSAEALVGVGPQDIISMGNAVLSLAVGTILLMAVK